MVGVTDEDVQHPADAFELLADETRVHIVRTLGNAWVQEWPGVLSYSALMERVGADDSGRFNYHLSRLVGRFVDEKEDGYTLNFTGLTIYRVLHAGTFTDVRYRGPFDAECACHACGSDLLARYERDKFAVECPDCGSRFAESPLPPNAATDRSQAALTAAGDALVRNYVRLLVADVCPWCAGGVHAEVLPTAESELDPTDALRFHVRHTCERCGGQLWEPVGLHALVDPLVAATLAEADDSDRRRPYWTFAFAVTDRYTTVLDRDPWRFGVDVPVDGNDDRRTAVLGPDLRVEHFR